MPKFSTTEGRNAARRKNYAAGGNVGAPYRFWGQEEDRAVLTRTITATDGPVRHDATDREIAAHLGRSVQAVQIRRSRLKARA